MGLIGRNIATLTSIPYFFLRFICRLRSVISSERRDYRYDSVPFESTKSITSTFSSIILVLSSSLRASFLVLRSYYYFSKRFIQPFAWGFITYIFLFKFFRARAHEVVVVVFLVSVVLVFLMDHVIYCNQLNTN